MEYRKPSVLIPYAGPRKNGDENDVFVYLRPETNGVSVESTLLRVIRGNPHYEAHNQMVYLANIPGDFMLRKHIVEEHYSLKVYFAAHGKDAFTAGMIEKFESFFQIDFNEAQILGAYEALGGLGLSPEELFRIWVDPFDILVVNGQSIKRKDDFFIVNYDIPALLHKNNNKTDIAVMIFRTSLPWNDFNGMIEDMGRALVRNGLMDPRKPASRFFHYSKGPFEEILDGMGYLYDSNARHLGIDQLSFVQYLQRRGLSLQEITGAVKNPIMNFRTSSGLLVEENLLDFTISDTYEEGFLRLASCESQAWLI